MEVDQKMETVEAVHLETEGKELHAAVKTDDSESREENMDVESKTMITESEEKENVTPLILKTETKSDDLVELIVEGIEITNDDNEEYVIMSPEEMQMYLTQKISEHMTDPKVNPVLGLQKRSQELLDEIKDRSEEISKLGKALDMIYRNQERFLRHVEIFPKVPTNSVSVSVDLPLLLDSVPLMSPSKAPDEEAVIRKDLSDAKVLIPTVSKNKPTAAVPISSSIPSLPSSTSITPVAPNISPPASVSNISPAASVSNISPAASVSNTSSTVSNTTPVSNLTTAVKSLPKIAPKPAGVNIECIDLTDDTPAPVPVGKPISNMSSMASIQLVKHPAPLPPKPFSAPNSSLPPVPPKPRLKISSEERGIVLQWDMPPSYAPLAIYAKLKSFDIFGYQEQKNIVINTLLWKKIGNVNAMTLPMACTLTQFLEGQKYHFAIRAVDIHGRFGSYSDPISIVYKPNQDKKT